MLHAHCEDVGRDPGEIEVSVQFGATDDPDATAGQGEAFAEAGADHLIIYFRAPFDPSQLGPTAAARAFPRLP